MPEVSGSRRSPLQEHRILGYINSRNTRIVIELVEEREGLLKIRLTELAFAAPILVKVMSLLIRFKPFEPDVLVTQQEAGKR